MLRRLGILVCWHTLLATILTNGATSSKFSDCPVKLERLGCYKDDPTDRAMSKQVLNGNDITSPHYSGSLIRWNDYENYLDDFVCSCAQKAFDLGHRVIGMQFYGECWASEGGHLEYARHGADDSCQNGKYSPCGSEDVSCTGIRSTNFVYRIAPSHCDLYFQPIGCYNDKGITPRPLPTYAMNERDYAVPNWNGRLIDWAHWNTYSPQMICRCAVEAKRRMQDYFAIQFYGDCWTSCSNSSNFYRDGPSDRCLAQNFVPANVNSYQGVGQDHTNYIYRLIPAPIVNFDEAMSATT